MEALSVPKTNKSSAIAKALLWVAIVEFVFIAIWAFATGGNMFDAVGHMITMPWELAAIGDLLLGLFVFSVFVWLNEDSKKNALLWTLGFFMLGNPVTAIYLILNYNQLREKLKG